MFLFTKIIQKFTFSRPYSRPAIERQIINNRNVTYFIQFTELCFSNQTLKAGLTNRLPVPSWDYHGIENVTIN